MRLGGNSLLDCVVYGRVCGRSAARYVMKQNIEAISKINAGAATTSSEQRRCGGQE